MLEPTGCLQLSAGVSLHCPLLDVRGQVRQGNSSFSVSSGKSYRSVSWRAEFGCCKVSYSRRANMGGRWCVWSWRGRRGCKNREVPAGAHCHRTPALPQSQAPHPLGNGIMHRMPQCFSINVGYHDFNLLCKKAETRKTRPRVPRSFVCLGTEEGIVQARTYHLPLISSPGLQ